MAFNGLSFLKSGWCLRGATRFALLLALIIGLVALLD